MWYDNKKDSEAQPVGYFAVWYRSGVIDGGPIGFQTAEDHPFKTERLFEYIHDRLLGRMARTEEERTEEVKKYVGLYLDVVKYRLDMDGDI